MRTLSYEIETIKSTSVQSILVQSFCKRLLHNSQNGGLANISCYEKRDESPFLSREETIYTKCMDFKFINYESHELVRLTFKGIYKMVKFLTERLRCNQPRRQCLPCGGVVNGYNSCLTFSYPTGDELIGSFRNAGARSHWTKGIRQVFLQFYEDMSNPSTLPVIVFEFQ